MLRCSSSEEERERRAARRAEINQERATYVQAADMEELRKLVAQSRRIEDDPHNKMHGRTVEDWHQDEPSQMPRRRRNKPSKKPMDSDEEEAVIERARREMMRKITGAAVRGEHAAVVAAASMQALHNRALALQRLRGVACRMLGTTSSMSTVVGSGARTNFELSIGNLRPLERGRRRA